MVYFDKNSERIRVPRTKRVLGNEFALTFTNNLTGASVTARVYEQDWHTSYYTFSLSNFDLNAFVVGEYTYTLKQCVYGAKECEKGLAVFGNYEKPVNEYEVTTNRLVYERK